MSVTYIWRGCAVLPPE